MEKRDYTKSIEAFLFIFPLEELGLGTCFRSSFLLAGCIVSSYEDIN